MQEMPQKSDAVQNGNFHATGFIVFGAGIFANIVGDRLGGDENLILDVLPLRRDFLQSTVYVSI